MMQHSDTLAELGKALAAVQGEMGHAPMNATNPFLKSKYADLGAIIETAKPVLPQHGLSYSQHPCGEGGRIGVETILMHSSGEWLSSRIEMDAVDERGKSAAQVAGSIITYLRRYALAAALGIYADEDNDGNTPARPRATKTVEQSPPATPSSAPAAKTPEQRARARMFALLADVGIGGKPNRDKALAFISQVVGRDVASSSEISDDEVQVVVQMLSDWKATGTNPMTGETA